MAVDPITSPGCYLDIRLAGKRFPGAIQSIEGLKNEEELVYQRPVAGTGATVVVRGRKPIESITVTVALHADSPGETSQAWQDHYAFVVFTRGKPPPLPMVKKPLGVTGTSFKDVGVKEVIYKAHTAGVFTVGKNVVQYIFGENAKSKTFAPDVPEPAILDAANPNPKTTQEIALADAASSAWSNDGTGPTGAEIVAQYSGVGQLGEP